ncbi:hypothetical protein [Actinotalea sp. K2]|uniref:hypothetical protein n=1 Tax=Actinotalea sp. K2 TaxID=2939438 RepID=UPI002016C051|nr:hypothetical protein [Actinotalea sp. K2]MCL3860644.1 hypothetical protein [Actinotalea sp. K2]
MGSPPYLVWLARRDTVLALAVSIALTVAAAALTGAIPTPQMRGPSLLLTVSTIHAMLLGSVIALAVRPADPHLEALSPRPMRTLRLTLGVGLLLSQTLLLVTAGALAELAPPQVLAGLRTLAVTAGVCALIARRASFPAAAMILLAYVGCVLFAGAEPDGDVAWWARLLAGWDAPVDLWLIGIGTAATCSAFLATPRTAPGT